MTLKAYTHNSYITKILRKQKDPGTFSETALDLLAFVEFILNHLKPQTYMTSIKKV